MKTIIITRSRKLLAYLIVSHSLTLMTLLSLAGLSWLSLFATLIIIASFIYYAGQHQWLTSQKSVVSINYHGDITWSLHYSDGSQKLRLKLTGSFVTPQLVIVYFNHRYFWQGDVITIIDDAVDIELFRQLRVYLRSPKAFQQ
jgi:hypothetical protein